MHGRRRDEYKALYRDPKTIQKLQQKALAWNQLSAELLQRQKQRTTDNNDETLLLLHKALSVNPDPYWLWNFRREILVSNNNSMDWETEASLTHAALMSNPKAYGAWHHRKYCLTIQQQQQESDAPDRFTTILNSELDLTAQFFQRDERNFHCWSYRRFVVGLMLGNSDGSWTSHDTNKVVLGGQLAGINQPETIIIQSTTKNHQEIFAREWAFTDQKIRDNFSNFSAFHYRSQLWKVRDTNTTGAYLDLLGKELELVENAVFTEPDDQTAWWYQAFLLTQNRSDDSTNNSNNRQEEVALLWRSHVENLRELNVETNHSSKWVLIGLLNCLEGLDHCDDNGSSLTEERKEILERLVEVDPDRKCRYQDLLAQMNESV